MGRTNVAAAQDVVLALRALKARNSPVSGSVNSTSRSGRSSRTTARDSLAFTSVPVISSISMSRNLVPGASVEMRGMVSCSRGFVWPLSVLDSSQLPRVAPNIQPHSAEKQGFFRDFWGSPEVAKACRDGAGNSPRFASLAIFTGSRRAWFDDDRHIDNGEVFCRGIRPQTTDLCTARGRATLRLSVSVALASAEPPMKQSSQREPSELTARKEAMATERKQPAMQNPPDNAPELVVPPLGLTCQGCGRKRFEVLWTRLGPGVIRRRRRCLDCRRRTTTCELQVDK
jgi:hypothetical protein